MKQHVAACTQACVALCVSNPLVRDEGKSLEPPDCPSSCLLMSQRQRLGTQFRKLGSTSFLEADQSVTLVSPLRWPEMSENLF